MAIAISIVLGPEPPPTVVKEQFGEQSHSQVLKDALHRAFDLIEGGVSPPARKHA